MATGEGRLEVENIDSQYCQYHNDVSFELDLNQAVVSMDNLPEVLLPLNIHFVDRLKALIETLITQSPAVEYLASLVLRKTYVTYCLEKDRGLLDFIISLVNKPPSNALEELREFVQSGGYVLDYDLLDLQLLLQEGFKRSYDKKE